ncbi:MAG: hypothetical protein H7X88_08200 [Gloeobacteraceae cyanobacterium ES-bin-316]|nr:hypothetical protein [Ferruginibacter sp.]
MNKDKLAQLVEETMNSMDAAERATPAPYLLTRLHARLRREEPSSWERIGFFLGRPGVAVAAVIFLIVTNVFIYSYSNPGSDINGLQNMQASADEYSVNNSSALFDIENIQP